jgi:hypothetical protein
MFFRFTFSGDNRPSVQFSPLVEVQTQALPFVTIALERPETTPELYDPTVHFPYSGMQRACLL